MPKAKPPEAKAASAPTEGEQKPRPSGLIPFQPGQSGNPAGRAKGSRNKLGEAFIADLYANWQQHGIETIETVRAEKPDQYLKVVASILPKELNVRVSELDELDDEQLDRRIASLASALRLAIGTGEGAGAEEAPQGSRAAEGIRTLQ
jgi:hypothetical protein